MKDLTEICIQKFIDKLENVGHLCPTFYMGIFMKDLLTEKYRPDTVENYVFTDENMKNKIMEWINNPNNKRIPFPNVLFSGSAGTGKAQPLSSLIKIPGSWKKMGDIEIGDIVTSWDGKPSKVTGIFPQGEKEVFKVTFKDNRSTIVENEHLWNSYKKDDKRWKIRNTKELQRILSLKSSKIYIPLCKSEDIEDIELPINPWLLGYILGNGGISSKKVMISTSDSFIVDKIKNIVESIGLQLKHICENDYRIVSHDRNNTIMKNLINLGLFGCNAYSKFIPQIYLNSSTEQRMELLKGLMDSDGTCDKSGSIRYSTSSVKLSEDFQYLVRSLGGIAKISKKYPTYTYKGIKKEGKVNYNINIRIRNPYDCFSLDRKRNRTSNNGQYCKNLKLEITKIESIGFEETQCIMIDHPDHLYITDDFVVTHNTTLAKILCNECDIEKGDILYINASRENNVDTVRNKIHDFCSTMPMGNFKVAILDECLSEDEEIKLSDGTFKKLKDMHFGETYNVLSFNMETKTIENDTAEVISKKEDDIYEVELSDGRKIQTTLDHPFLINNNGTIVQKKLKDIVEGDMIVSEEV